MTNELKEYLQIKLDSLKAEIENYEDTVADEIFDYPEVKELYHKDLRIYNELKELLNK